jgi:hypothetical protein
MPVLDSGRRDRRKSARRRGKMKYFFKDSLCTQRLSGITVPLL